MPSAGEATASRRRVAVVGAGISGLSSAILLQVARAPRPTPSVPHRRGRAAAGQGTEPAAARLLACKRARQKSQVPHTIPPV
jgi:glycine/D-amino acid oxidase-like deaminating enzyme